MKHAISIMQPWPWAIFYAGKDFENRTWRIPARFVGVDLLLHTGKRPDTMDTWDWIARVGGKRPPLPSQLPFGALIGTIRFAAAIPAAGPAAQDLSPWACGSWCWPIVEARPFPRPIPCRGQRSFWEPPEWTGRIPPAPVVQGDLFGGGR